jgi:hypothetical protein
MDQILDKLKKQLINILKPNLSKNIFYYDEDEIILNIDEFKDGYIK